jgi:hypothetical protein
MSEKVRYSIYVNKELSDMVESEAERLGVGKSGFFNMALSQYKMQKDATEMKSQVDDMLKTMKQMMKTVKDKTSSPGEGTKGSREGGEV